MSDGGRSASASRKIDQTRKKKSKDKSKISKNGPKNGPGPKVNMNNMRTMGKGPTKSPPPIHKTNLNPNPNPKDKTPTPSPTRVWHTDQVKTVRFTLTPRLLIISSGYDAKVIVWDLGRYVHIYIYIVE